MTDQKMEVLYMSLYSAGYEEFVDEVLQNGCNGIVEKMRKSSKEKLFPKAVKKCEERIWKKTLPEFFKHLIDLKYKHSVTPTHIFLNHAARVRRPHARNISFRVRRKSEEAQFFTVTVSMI